jgi:hypothetical protein
LVETCIPDSQNVERVIACSDGLLPELDATLELADPDLEARLTDLARQPISDDIALIDIALAPNVLPATYGEMRRTTFPLVRQDAEPTVAYERTDVDRPLPRARHASNGSDEPLPTSPPSKKTIRADDRQPEPPPAGKGEQPTGDELHPPRSLQWRATDEDQAIDWDAVEGADAYSVQLSEDASFRNPVDYFVADHTTLTLPVLPTGLRWARVRAHAADNVGPWGKGFEQALPQSSLSEPDDHSQIESLSDPTLLMPPSGLAFSYDRLLSKLHLRWDAEPGPAMYSIMVRDATGSRQEYRTKEPHISVNADPGKYLVQLRTHIHRMSSEWSVPYVVG